MDGYCARDGSDHPLWRKVAFGGVYVSWGEGITPSPLVDHHFSSKNGHFNGGSHAPNYHIKLVSYIASNPIESYFIVTYYTCYKILHTFNILYPMKPRYLAIKILVKR